MVSRAIATMAWIASVMASGIQSLLLSGCGMAGRDHRRKGERSFPAKRTLRDS
jgi:hypothetical protein